MIGQLDHSRMALADRLDDVVETHLENIGNSFRSFRSAGRHCPSKVSPNRHTSRGRLINAIDKTISMRMHSLSPTNLGEKNHWFESLHFYLIVLITRRVIPEKFKSLLWTMRLPFSEKLWHRIRHESCSTVKPTSKDIIMPAFAFVICRL